MGGLYYNSSSSGKHHNSVLINGRQRLIDN